MALEAAPEAAVFTPEEEALCDFWDGLETGGGGGRR